MLEAGVKICLLIQERSLLTQSSVNFQLWPEDLEKVILKLFSWLFGTPHFLPPLHIINYFSYSNIWHKGGVGTQWVHEWPKEESDSRFTLIEKWEGQKEGIIL